jgi:curli biogenesis system outer membrane secretion channel CsgG
MKKSVGLVCLFLAAWTHAFGANAQTTAQVRKPVVAVSRIDDPGSTGQADALKTMIQTAVTGTGKFRIIERDFGQLDTEQQLARSGRVTTNRPGRSGGYEGVDFLVYGSITSTNGGRQSDVGANAGGALLGRMTGLSLGIGNCNKAVATFAVDVKIVDTVTGEVKFAKQLTQRSASGTSCGGAASLDTTTIMRGIANQIAMGLAITMYPVKVAAVQPDGVFILNYGEGALTVGTVMGVFDKGQEIRDPDTGAVMTSEGAELGRIRVTEVNTRFSKAEPLTAFAIPPAPGAVARILNDTELRQKGRKR